MSTIPHVTTQVRPTSLTPVLLARLIAFVKKETGLCVDTDKQYLFESKLGPILVSERIRSFDVLVEVIEKDRTSCLARQVAEAMTINETHFFRDRAPFTDLKEVIQPLLLRRSPERNIRIWSAACSTGQELYSIAMVLDELGSMLSTWKVDLIGTDISDAVLERARKGTYSQFEVQRGLPVQLLLKKFARVGDEWQIEERLRRAAKFEKLNLLDDLSPLGAFDVIFCRNVLFYFEPAMRARILSKISAMLRPDGYIVLGTSESMSAIAGGFRPAADGGCFYN